MFVIIVGGGKVGAHLARLLARGGKRVCLVEERRELIPALTRALEGVQLFEGSGSNPRTLEQAGVREADVVAAVTGSDDANLVVAGLARAEFKVRRVIARVNDPEHLWLFTPQMGVDVALNQADILSHLIAEELSLGEMTTLLKLRTGEYSLVEEKVHPRSGAAGRAIMALPLPAESVIAAVIRGGRLIVPRGNLVLEPGDEVLALVHAREMGRLSALLGAPEGG
ncbi:TrkA family potassium uptake protein [Geomonas sp. Red69]|uniref:TrkA family potassium uptake protein n=1 Tax=Geomonas diazotrophica TaxID=2843197 RepID=A0ABX8JM01_9BACT|nr:MULTISPECIES: TrkA family potassium uptake protein [Geomonas]MBU5638724.1 TrkA family potassium uptake protein [Geomonas diazotrophica]QWV98699.1 TrkA family potassium uptake protein [Geomonas nitrogeniifigens]QXE87856.1 TrkA family potassium uptake protein [Geomonas nitrogeniifigens]